jgi:hypothetical protein
VKLTVWILASLGVVLLAVAVWMAGKSAVLMSTGTRTVGEIVDVRLHAPVVQFRAEGRIVRGQLPRAKDPIYVKGDHVPLYYAIEAPQRFVVAEFDQMWGRPIVVSCMALVLFAAARIVRMAVLGEKASAILSLTLQLIGTALLAAGAIVALSQWAELRRSIHTIGMANERGEITFTTTAGRKLTASDDAVGAQEESVHVFYDPERPERARVATFGALWLNAILLGLFGLAFYGAGALVAKRSP